jgi:hypothetical protein
MWVMKHAYNEQKYVMFACGSQNMCWFIMIFPSFQNLMWGDVNITIVNQN